MVVYLPDDNSPEPEHKWLNIPMSFHELLAEIIGTALECEDIPVDSVNFIAIESYHNSSMQPYGGFWLVSVLQPVEEQPQHLSEERCKRLQELRARYSTRREIPIKITASIGILYSEGDFYPDLL